MQRSLSARTAAATPARTQAHASIPALAARAVPFDPDDPVGAPLASPEELRRRLPAAPALKAIIARSRREISDVLRGHDPSRLVVVVGPCSIHDPESAVEYARRLAGEAAEHRDELVLVMRTYLEKPRSLLGWKGYLNDPDLDGSCDAARGIELSRELLLAVGELGLPCASELLDPIAARYLEDLLSWTAIGARTAESQIHRELASGLRCPVGIKNGLDGDLTSAVHGALAAASPHTSLALDDAGRAVAVRSEGNPGAHVVLRGGREGSNHDPNSVAAAARGVEPLGLQRPVFVDCSHGNSARDHRRQASVCREVLEQLRGGQTDIGGLLLESHLEPGRQEWAPGQAARPNQSITDACMGWDETGALLGEIATSVRLARE
jgi:3-deoxy-7-phosphoheptulonate synthase